MNIGSQAHLTDVAGLVDAQLLGVVAGDVEGRLIVAARRRDTVLLPATGAERAVRHERIEFEQLDLRACARGDRREEALLRGIDRCPQRLKIRGPVGLVVDAPALAEDLPLS